MKRYIQAAKSRPYTVSKNKFYKAIAYRDTVEIVPISNYHFREQIKDSMNRWADSHGLSYKDLNYLKGHYYVDTQGHVDFAALSDDEDLYNLEFTSLHDAIRNVIQMINDDLAANSRQPEIIGADISLDIYGYGNHHLNLSDRRCALNTHGFDLASLNNRGYGIAALVSGNNVYLDLYDALADNTEFKRKQLPSIVKYLANPIERLKR